MNRPIRVLSVQHYPVFGGPHNEILRLEPALNRLGVKTIVAHTDDPGNATARLHGQVEIHEIALNRIHQTKNLMTHALTAASAWQDVGRLRALIREQQIDVVKVHGPHNPQGALAAKLEGACVVWVVSSTRVPRGFRTLGGHLVRMGADAVLVDGRSLIDAYPGLGACSARTFVYYPPVDTGVFRPSQEHRLAVRVELGIPLDAPVVGMVANLSPQKGIEYFVRAMPAIIRDCPATRFVLVGAEYATQVAYSALVRRELAATGIDPGVVTFAGERRDVDRFYPAMDVKLITSIPNSEGTTTTAMEAMACEVPVVATNVGAVHEVVEDGVTGLLVQPNDPKSIAKGVTRLLRDASLRRKLGLRGRERAVERFDVAVCAQTHYVAYSFALQQHANRLKAA